MSGGIDAGNATKCTSFDVVSITVGASSPSSGTVGVVRTPVLWGRPYANPANLSVFAATHTTSVSSGVFAVTVSQVSSMGAVVNILRMDIINGGWADSQLRIVLKIVEIS